MTAPEPTLLYGKLPYHFGTVGAIRRGPETENARNILSQHARFLRERAQAENIINECR